MGEISVKLSSASDPKSLKYNLPKGRHSPIYLPLHKHVFTARAQKSTSRKKIVAVQNLGNGSSFQNAEIFNLNKLVTKLFVFVARLEIQGKLSNFLQIRQSVTK